MTTATEPSIIEDGPRHLRAEWEIDTHEDERGNAVTELAVLSVFHHGGADYGPMYCYTATLDRQQQIDNGEYKMRRQTIGITYRSSVDVGTREAKRYSAKRAREFFDESFNEVVRRHDARNPDVLAVFGEGS